MFNVRQFGIKRLIIRRGEDLEEVKKIVSELSPENVIISIYVFESKQHRDQVHEMFKNALQLMK